jgi:hypothetical protein
MLSGTNVQIKIASYQRTAAIGIDRAIGEWLQ